MLQHVQNSFMAVVVPIAHDFTCIWCWISLSQVKRMRQEFGVEVEWLPFEVFPDPPEEEGPGPASPESDGPARPLRGHFAFAAEGIEVPRGARKEFTRTARAHAAVEFAKEHGVADELVERLYIAFWQHGLDISQPEVLRLLSKGLIADEEALVRALDDPRYRDRVVRFDADAHARGVYSVPTYFIDGERYPEPPYRQLREVLSKLAPVRAEMAEEVYRGLLFPAGPPDRPYVAINMVTTIDGKIVTGSRNEPVMDLGSAVDHAVLRRLEHAAQAVMIGAGTLRATPRITYPPHLFRFVVSATGDVDWGSRFFTEAPERAYLVLLGGEGPDPSDPRVLRPTGVADMLARLRHDLGIQTLLVEGGSELNAALLAHDCVDELFLTIAPKVKLGRDTPTYAGGRALPRDCMLRFELVDHRAIADEVFLRYRRLKGDV